MPVPGPQNLCNGNTPSLPCIHSLYVVYTTAAVSTCYEEHCGAAILSIARAMRVTITVHVCAPAAGASDQQALCTHPVSSSASGSGGDQQALR
jgi:hypothetical protein